MKSVIPNTKEFWSGIMFVVIALAALILSRDLPLGSTGRMGAGYFPTALAILLGIIGLVSIVRSYLDKGEKLERFAIKETVLILLAVLLFGVLVRGAGLVVSIILLVMVSAYASKEFHWKPALLLAIGAAVFSVVVFVNALGMPIPAFGPWLGM